MVEFFRKLQCRVIKMFPVKSLHVVKPMIYFNILRDIEDLYILVTPPTAKIAVQIVNTFCTVHNINKRPRSEIRTLSAFFRRAQGYLACSIYQKSTRLSRMQHAAPYVHYYYFFYLRFYFYVFVGTQG